MAEKQVPPGCVHRKKLFTFSWIWMEQQVLGEIFVAIAPVSLYFGTCRGHVVSSGVLI